MVEQSKGNVIIRMASLRMLREAHTHSFHSVLLVLCRFMDAHQEPLQNVEEVRGVVYEVLITIIIVTFAAPPKPV